MNITHYIDGYQYKEDKLDFFPHAEGYVKVTHASSGGVGGGSISYNYVFNYTDHLGNIRLRYAINPVNQWLEILEEDHYYPFGLKHNGYNAQNYVFMSLGGGPVELIPTNPNVLESYKFKYNGKEFQDELGLNMYAMDMRQYDPAIGRWVVQDPIVHFDYSTYSAFDNNPVFWADPSGADSSTDIWGRNRFDKYGMYVPPYMRGAKSNSYEDCDDCSVCPEKCNDSNRGRGKSQSGQTNSGGGGCPPECGDEIKSPVLKNTPNKGEALNESSLASSSLGAASKFVYNEKLGIWMDKQGNIRSTDWGGNETTGGKNKFAKNLSKGLNRAGTILGVINYGVIGTQYDTGQIDNFTFLTETGSNTISTFGGLSGAAWGLGWEAGRGVTSIPGYDKNVRQPLREAIIKYNPSLMLLVNYINQY